MKHLVAFLVAFALTCCVPPAVSRRPDVAHQRAGLTHLLISADATARQCTGYAQWLARGDFEAKERSSVLFETCSRRLLPLVDAIHVAVKAADPWTREAEPAIACAGAATTEAFKALRADFARLDVKPPELLSDGIQIGAELAVHALASCDPLHPTTTVTVSIDPRIPPVEP